MIFKMFMTLLSVYPFKDSCLILDYVIFTVAAQFYSKCLQEESDWN